MDYKTDVSKFGVMFLWENGKFLFYPLKKVYQLIIFAYICFLCQMVSLN